MAMMNGRGGAVHTLDLRLASKDKNPAPQADHLIPPGLQMGPSLPLLTPVREEAPPSKPGMPTQWQQPKGRMLIYWGCGEHVSAGQPTVIDFSKMQPGKVPPGMAAMASMAHMQTGPTSAPGFGRWPNERDRRPVPANGSLLGAHKVQANYAPPIAFSLGAGQDFMPALGSKRSWRAAVGRVAAGVAAGGTGDGICADDVRLERQRRRDHVELGEIGADAGDGLSDAGRSQTPDRRGGGASADNEPVRAPAEVASASPQGMVMMIGYGPEADFSDKPKLPTWTTKVRFKTTASLMRGMGAMMGNADAADEQEQAPQQQQPKKRRGIGLGDILGAIPH